MAEGFPQFDLFPRLTKLREFLIHPEVGYRSSHTHGAAALLDTIEPTPVAWPYDDSRNEVEAPEAVFETQLGQDMLLGEIGAAEALEAATEYARWHEAGEPK